MSKLISWIKQNKLATALLGLILVLVIQQWGTSSSKFAPTVSNSFEAIGQGGTVGMAEKSLMMPTAMDSSFPGQEAAPAPEVTNRMVVTNSYLSLVVKDVNQSITDMKSYAQSIGGYMVNSNISRPEEGGTGTLIIRIPADKLDEALANLKGKSVKVVSENLDGQDVTDQFVDNAARLVILEKNKARFEEIMNEAKDVTEILRVQREIFSLQSQIDSIKGQQKYLEQTSKMALVTLYLSTDELALPYSPTNAWRPEVVFKTAVRSLMTTAQSAASMAIWIGVFAIIWLPIVIIVLLVARKRRRSNVTPPSQA